MEAKVPPGATVPDATNPFRATFAPRPATSEVLPAATAPEVIVGALEPAPAIKGRKVTTPDAPGDGA